MTLPVQSVFKPIEEKIVSPKKRSSIKVYIREKNIVVERPVRILQRNKNET